jgi:hypothetical protein
VPAKTVKNSAAEPDTRPFWHCPVCGLWCQVDSDGNVGDHFSTYGSCPGSGEPTAFTRSALSEEGQDALPGRVVELAKSVVRALQPGARYRCESEDELRERLEHAGVDCDSGDLAVALDMLEQNGVGALDTGGLPGVPYRVLRPESRYPRTKDNPSPPRPIVLQELRSL